MGASSPMRKMIEAHKTRAQFFLVYMREAHPIDGDWGIDVKLNEPRTYEERVAAAGACSHKLDLEVPVLVDDMRDSTARAYNAWPERIYVVDTQQVIRFKGRPGPFGFSPKEAQRLLDEFVGEDF